MSSPSAHPPDAPGSRDASSRLALPPGSGTPKIVKSSSHNLEDETGILIDWDYKEELGSRTPGPAHHWHARSGTWAFMSGVGQKYPYKPNDLADDFESFVHVICHNALQYHRHNKTVLHRTYKYSPEDLKKANAKNQKLGAHMFDMYYISISQEGIHTGGEQKVMRATTGSPGFQLADKQSPLAALIADLYKLLKAHYAAIDFAHLQQYAVNPPRTPLAEEKKVFKRRISASRGPGAKRVIPVCKPHEPTAVLARVLDSHAAIRQAFREAVQEIQANAEEQGGYELDKLQDQFVGMPVYFLAEGLTKWPLATE